MKNLKKMIMLLTVFIFTFSMSTVVVGAEEKTNFVSITEFETIMNELYSKYDSKISVSDLNNIQYVSREYVENIYAIAATALEEKAAIQEKQVQLLHLSDIEYNNENGMVSPRVASVHYYDSDTFKVSGATVPLATANYKVELSGTVNAQYNSFISLNYSGIYQNGYAVNYDGFDIISESTGYMNNNTAYMVGVTMDVYFSWTDPTTGLRFSETVRHYYLNTFHAEDGI